MATFDILGWYDLVDRRLAAFKRDGVSNDAYLANSISMTPVTGCHAARRLPTKSQHAIIGTDHNPRDCGMDVERGGGEEVGGRGLEIMKWTVHERMS